MPIEQALPTGTPLSSSQPQLPILFTPIKLRSLTLQNRIIVSPMGTYNSQDGHFTDFHLVHLGSYALRGAGLTIAEATAVLANGRTSPLDAGLYLESHIEPMKRVTEFAHGLGQKIGIQLAHAGNKASMNAILPGKRPDIATEELGGWPGEVWGPSALKFTEGYLQPLEMTTEQITEVVHAYAEAARKAVRAGFDMVEIHAGHGYLVSTFLSPLSNHRTDEYGGGFEQRIRFLVEIVTAVRAALPESMPLFVRISATEWMEWSGGESWDIHESIRLAKVLADLGVDLLDVSSGGNNVAQKIPGDADYQINWAGQIRAALKKNGLKMLVGAVGRVVNAEIARNVLEEEKADVVLVGKEFLRDPNFVLKAAQELGVSVQWPMPYWRAAPAARVIF